MNYGGHCPIKNRGTKVKVSAQISFIHHWVVYLCNPLLSNYEILQSNNTLPPSIRNPYYPDRRCGKRLVRLWPAFPAYLIGLIMIAGHFFIGPLRLIQEYMEKGDMEGAERVVNSVKYPNLLYKPIRSAYYTVKGQMDMMKQDFDSAEKI